VNFLRDESGWAILVRPDVLIVLILFEGYGKSLERGGKFVISC